MSAVCRPPRDSYEDDDLVGGLRAAFAFGETHSRIKKYYRQDVEIRNSRNQRLQCSHYRPCVVTSRDGRLPCVIYCHTNSGSRRDAQEVLFTLLPKGITVFAFDFSGSGLSDGQFVTLGAHEEQDLAAVVQYLREEGSTSTLALWGRSMGAVTALLYAHKDPSIAGVVMDSPFSRLTDLMLELARDSEQGLSVARPLVKVALAFMRRSVRRKAGFVIDQVAPLDIAPQTFVPALFGHATGDTFVLPHHSERLFEALGSDTKNFISFEGEHNGMRPDFWYDSAMIFLLGVLRVEELVGPDIDLHSIGPEEAPHMHGQGIYVAGSSTGEAGDGEDEPREFRRSVTGPAFITGRRQTLEPQWEDHGFYETSVGGPERWSYRSELLCRETEPSHPSSRRQSSEDGLYNSEEATLQRIIALSLAEAAETGARPAGQMETVSRTPAGTAAGTAGVEEYDEEAALAAAIAASLASSNNALERNPSQSSEGNLEQGDDGSVTPTQEALPSSAGGSSAALREKERLSRQVSGYQEFAMEHSSNEAAAAHAAVDHVQSALSKAIHQMDREGGYSHLPGSTDLVIQWPPGQSPTPRSENGDDGSDNVTRDESSTVEEVEQQKEEESFQTEENDLEALRAQVAKYSGYS